jgi:hypothetical protein
MFRNKITRLHKAVLWIRIRKDPKLFAGSGSVTRGFGSGSGSTFGMRIQISIWNADPNQHSECGSGSAFGMRIRTSIRNADPDQHSECGSGTAFQMLIRISIRNADPDQHSECGSGSSKCKISKKVSDPEHLTLLLDPDGIRNAEPDPANVKSVEIDGKNVAKRQIIHHKKLV